MNIDFYQIAKIIDEIKNLQNPSEDQIEIILNLISEEKYARYFFSNLENPVWIVPLYNNGFFHNYPNPIEVQPGSFHLPGWPAGEYLACFANKYEEIMIDLIKSIRTENWRVQEILVDALIKISPSAAAGLISSIDAWLNGRFSDMLPNKLISLANHLCESGFPGAAIQILEYVIMPVLLPTMGEYSKYRSPVRFRTDHYWVNEYCEKQMVKLRAIDLAGVVSAFERQLLKMIGLVNQTNPDDADLQVGYYWRMDIPNRQSERSDADALDILVDGLRDGLAEICKQSVEDGEQILKKHLFSEHLIFQRVALHTLCSYGHNYPSLLNQAFLQRDYLENGEYANEYRGLMRNQFANASEEVRAQIIEWIISGPLDVDSRAIRHTQREHREVTEDDRRKVREEWTLYHLEIIRDFLPGEAVDLLNELTRLYGKPDIEERPHIVTTSWRGTPGPISAEELAKKSFDELKELFLTFFPEDLFLNPRESMAQTLQETVRDDPARYSAFAAYLSDPTIRFVYIYNFLSGIRESLKNQVGKLGDDIIGLCEYVVTQKEDPFEKNSGYHEPGLFATQMEVAWLLEEALHSEDPYLTRRQLDRIRALLILLAQHPDPEKGSDASGSFDPFTHSLNCVRGVAMHGVMHYSLYIIRQQEKIKNVKLKAGFLEHEITDVLEQKLDLALEPSLAVHAVFGAYVPQLHFLNSGWLEERLGAIFPVDEDRFAYWKAAWDAYIFASNVYRDVFTLLIPQYQRIIRLLSQPQDEQKHLVRSPNERLAQHLMFAYLAGLIDFGHENSLLDSFFANAPDPIRANGVFWLSQVLGNDKPSTDDLLWEKCWKLWQNRLRHAESQEITQNTQEISEYMRWLVNCPIELDILFPILSQTVKYLNDSFDAGQLTSYAAKYCDRFPLEAVTLLQMTILWAKEPWWTPEEKDEEKILGAAMASGISNASHIAVEVINYQGERGDFRWKSLLA
jgi:hypothetical protein